LRSKKRGGIFLDIGGGPGTIREKILLYEIPQLLGPHTLRKEKRGGEYTQSLRQRIVEKSCSVRRLPILRKERERGRSFLRRRNEKDWIALGIKRGENLSA